MKTLRKMRRAALLLAAMLLVVSAFGCGKKNATDAKDKRKNEVNLTPEGGQNPENPGDKDPEKPGETPVDDPNGAYCGPVMSGELYYDFEVRNGRDRWTFRSNDSGCTMTDYGLFSSHKLETEDGMVFEFRLTDVGNGESKVIGSVAIPKGEQGYETDASRVLINGRLITLMTIGDMYDPESMLTQYILDFDLEAGTMKTVEGSDNGFPYTMLTLFCGTVTFYNIDSRDGQYCAFYMYHSETGTPQEIDFLRLPWGEGPRHEAVRGLYSDGGVLYVLRVVYEGNVAKQMFVDKYNNNSTKLAEIDVTAAFTEAVCEHGPADVVPDEMIQYMVAFRVIDERYLFIENSSVTSFLYDLTEKKLMMQTGLGAALTSDPNVNIFYWREPEKALADTNAHCYRFNRPSTERINFASASPNERITDMTVAPNGTALITWSELVPDGHGGAEFTGKKRMEVVTLTR